MCLRVCPCAGGRLRGKAGQEGEKKRRWGGREELVGVPPKVLGGFQGGELSLSEDPVLS